MKLCIVVELSGALTDAEINDYNRRASTGKLQLWELSEVEVPMMSDPVVYICPQCEPQPRAKSGLDFSEFRGIGDA